MRVRGSWFYTAVLLELGRTCLRWCWATSRCGGWRGAEKEFSDAAPPHQVGRVVTRGTEVNNRSYSSPFTLTLLSVMLHTLPCLTRRVVTPGTEVAIWYLFTPCALNYPSTVMNFCLSCCTLLFLV